jgi:tol-pal system protein YbgF
VRRALIGLAMGVLAACSTTRPEDEPAYIKAVAVEERVDRLEHQNTALLDMQRQLEATEASLRRLQGQLEENHHGTQAKATESRNLYNDLEARLKALESRPEVVAPVAPSTPVVSDNDVYQAALELIKKRDYAGGEGALKAFISAYPQSVLIDNAKYWIGESYYSEGTLPEAVAAFTRLLNDHPDSKKTPDALLMIGKSQTEQKRFKEARAAFARLIKSYGDAPAAAEARTRLKKLDAEHH